MFIGYIAHIANLIRVATIITDVGDQSRRVLVARYPPAAPPPGPPQPLPAVVRTIPAPRAGVVVSVNDQVLTRLAANAGCVLVLAVRVGDFVPAGAPLFAVHTDDADVGAAGAGAGAGHRDRRIVGEVALDSERTMEQDLAFGFRQLVDIAERALSPAVNDPTTAPQAIDAVHDLLRALASRQLPGGRSSGPDGRLRLVVPQYGFGDFLDLAVGRSGGTARTRRRSRAGSPRCSPTWMRRRCPATGLTAAAVPGECRRCGPGWDPPVPTPWADADDADARWGA